MKLTHVLRYALMPGRQLRRSAAVCFCVLVLAAGGATAASHSEGDNSNSGKQLDKEAVATIDQSLKYIASNLESLDKLERSLEFSDDLQRKIFNTRIERLRSSTLESVTGLANELADRQEDGFDVSAYEASIVAYLKELPSAIEGAVDPIDQGGGFPDSSMSAIEIAVSDEKIFEAANRFDDGSWALKRGIDAARRLGLDTAHEEVYLAKRVTDFAAGVSIYLDLAAETVSNLNAAAQVLPDDVELQAKVLLAARRVQRTAGVLENNLPLFDFLGLDTTFYTQQLVLSTGQVSTDVFDADLLGALLSDWGGSMLDTIRMEAPNLVFQVFLFVLILFVFFKLARVVEKLVARGLASSKIEVSALLRRMVTSVSYNAVIVIGLLMALSQIGISLGPLLAGLGIAGFILGFALQDSLANFASGMLILVYKPYDVGDMVEVGGAFGTVERMSLVNTTILTLDNQTLIVPNNKIWLDVIKNLTYQHIRRVDMEFGIAYDQDIDEAERVLHEVVESDERVLEDPEPNIRVHTLGDSSVNFIVRPWVKTDDYWDVYWDITKKVKQCFDAEGISIPFPQRDVHLFAGEPAVQGFVNSVTDKAASDPSETGTIDNDEAAGENDG